MKARVLLGVIAVAGLVLAPVAIAQSSSSAQSQSQTQGQSQASEQPQAAPQGQSQSQQIRSESLGEAARRIREERRMASVKEKVWTNENIPTGEIGLVSRAPNADEFSIAIRPSEQTAAPAGAPVASPEEEAARSAAERAVAAEKARLATLQNDLTLIQRDYELSRQQFYSNPGYTSDTAGQQRLTAQQAQIDSKTTEIAAAQARVTALEQELAAVNERLGPRPVETPTAADVQAQWAARMEPLRRELQAVEAEIERVRAQLPSTPAPSEGAGNDFTQDQLRRLEGRRDDLRRQIAGIEEDARRSGVPAGWTRPPL